MGNAATLNLVCILRDNTRPMNSTACKSASQLFALVRGPVIDFRRRMTSSPAKNGPHIPSPTSTGHRLSSPRSTRTLRKLQSAHQLSSNYNALNAPSLISQQRQQQQRTPSSSQSSTLPPVPSISAHHSPQKTAHHRTRSNSDAVMPSDHNSALITRRTAPLKKQSSATTKDELRALITRGPRGDIDNSLQRLRSLIIDNGIETDNDGMVSLVIPMYQSIY